MSSAKKEVSWSYRFRMAAVSSGVGAVIWTVLMIIPASPFSSVQPILVGGGPGTWLLLGYVLYMVAGFCALAGMSALLHTIENAPRGSAFDALLMAGLGLYYAGVTATSLLLGWAGYVGGYANTISRLPESSIESLLTPYVQPVTLGALAACAGALIIMLSLGLRYAGET
ncbi:MAG: hypothetical protein ABSG92_07145 [Conexivisphaerales archaeon]